jgi:transcriptional regulator with XRE-family HTH domain
MSNQAAGENPLKVFGAMLAYYRNRIGMTPEQLGARVYLSGSQIRKVEAGTRTPSEDLAKACEAIPELGCNGALTELYEILSVHLKRRAYPGWFAGWPDKEAQARRLRWFEPLVVPGLLQTEAYARAIQDAASSGQIAEDAVEVDALAVTWDTLRLDALPRTASISLITSVTEAV